MNNCLECGSEKIVQIGKAYLPSYIKKGGSFVKELEYCGLVYKCQDCSSQLMYDERYDEESIFENEVYDFESINF